MRSEAQAIEKKADGLFRVQMARGDFFANAVVNATGYFSNPFIPSIAGASESKIPQLQVSEHNNYRTDRSTMQLSSRARQLPSEGPREIKKVTKVHCQTGAIIASNIIATPIITSHQRCNLGF